MSNKLVCGVSTGGDVFDSVNDLIDENANRYISPPVVLDSTIKIIERISANELAVYTAKKRKGYIRAQLKNNVTTTTESLATTLTDITTFRTVGITNCVDVCIGYTLENASVGTWSNPNLITGIEESFDAGIEYKYKQAAGPSEYEVSIVVPTNGYFNIGFLASNSSSTAITLSVDGVDIETFSAQNATAQLVVREYTADPGVRLIKIRQSLAAKFTNFLGCNFFKLKNALPDLSYDN